MNLNDLLLEGPYGTPYTQETFFQSFEGVIRRNVIGGEKGAILCAPAGVYVDMRPCANEISIRVFGFNPDHPKAAFDGKWENQKIFKQVEKAFNWVQNQIANSF